VAAHDWEIDIFDTKLAFLWGKLREDVYMCQLPGFKNGASLVCHLLSSLYGLKQATYDLYELLHVMLIGLGFLHCEADYAVFVYDYVNGEEVCVICIIAWHVDDSLAGCNNCKFLDWTKGRIADCFGIADLGPVVKHLGVQYVCLHTTRELWMHQQEYIVYLLEEHGLH
jgi:hypothetical protein